MEKEPGFIPDDQFVSDEQELGTLPEQAKLFGMKAAEAATFGLSTELLARQNLIDIEKAKRREEVSPGVALAGEAAGVGASLLIPGAAAVTPVGMVARGAEAVAKAAEPAVARVVSRIANPETAARVNRILTKAGSTAIGSALEGGVYGLGQSISEDALGDHGFNGETLMHNIGMGSLVGGLSGGAIGGLMGAIKAPKPIATTAKDILNEAGIQQESNFVDNIMTSSLDESEKAGVLSGLAEQKKNIKQIEEAASRLEVPVLVGQRAGNETVQKTYSTLVQAPTVPGINEANKIKQAFEVVEEKVGQTLGAQAPQYSKAQMGVALADSIAAKFEAAYKPIKDLYEVVKNRLGKINITDDEKLMVMERISNMAKKEGLLTTGESQKFVNAVLNDIPYIKTYSEMDQLTKGLYKQASNNDKWLAQAIRNEIEDTTSSILMDFADQVGAADITGDIATTLAAAKVAKPAYKKLITDMQDIGKVIGKSKIRGPADFIDFLTEVQTPEKLADKLFQKQNSRFLKKFSKDFPQEWEVIKNYQKNKLFGEATKKGSFNFNKVIDSVDKMEPELKAKMFTKKELQTLDDAKVWIQAFPKKFNPSETSTANAFKEFFQSPVAATIQNLRDVGFKAGYKALGLSAQEQNRFQLLRKVEESKIKLELKIKTGSKSIFEVGDKVIKAEAPSFGQDEDMKKNLQEYANNPEVFIDKMEQNTRNLYENAPQIATAFQGTASKAAMLLISKLPQIPTKRTLGVPYKVSNSDTAKFSRYLDAINNPTKIFDQIKAGNVSADYMEAVKTVYPQVFQKMQEETLQNITDLDEDKITALPYKVKMGLSMFLETDLANGLSQQSIVANQTSFNQPKGASAGGVKPTQKGLDRITASNMAMTPFQKASNRKV